ncbi:MAG TPA: family 16 glycosylhydrolase [Ohtaekwangia sp.]|uniref:family 16 glycosylhydrolase n=1 Tax=Ohtaekwangia sp. TaxID=2066019 RepID=UPI002F958DC3
MIRKIRATPLFAFLSILGVIIGCSNGDSEQKLTLPSNLQVQVTVSQDGSGLVTVAASATNANFYKIYFGDVSSEVPTKVTDGKTSHTYANTGTYTVKVQAHATDADFISDTKTISVTVGASGDIIIPASGYTTPDNYNGMTLVWKDEFNGTSLNASDWTFETGTGSNGWGNHELEYYRADNTTVQNGYLIITAKKENFSGSNYTSSRIITSGKQSFKYGRVDIRAALPKGKGIWPALWMLGQNIGEIGWPKCGEIDIMELIGGDTGDKTVHSTLHWDDAGTHASYGTSYTLPSGIFNDEFHVFSMVWTSTSITTYVDDQQFYVIDTTPAQMSEFQQKFFFIFNVAVGGDWPGSPDANTSFPQRMIVDYIRVFQ